MIISHKHKFIYFANGKCASSTIENALVKYNDDDRIRIDDLGYGKKGIWCKKKLNSKKHIKNLWGCNTEHVPPFLVKEELGKIFDEYFKFSFVRNPYSWIVSQYFWNFEDRPDVLTPKHLERVFNFLKKVRRGIQGKSKFQYSFLADKHGQGDLLVDFVGKVENFDNDFKFVCDKIGMEVPEKVFLKMNQKKSNKHYLEFLTEESIKFVQSNYRKDIEYFKYKLGQ